MKARILYVCRIITLYILTTLHAAVGAPGDVQAGKTLYVQLCVGCHGPTGQGGNMMAVLAVPPRNLTDPTYMTTRSDQQLFDVISKGGAAMGLSAAMTAFEHQLTEQQIWDTVAYVRTLAAPRRAAAESPRSTLSEEQGSAADLIMTRLRLSIWPEYDDPRVLIMLRGELTPSRDFPTMITLSLPKEAEIIGAGMISEQDEPLLQPYQVLPGDAQDILQLTLPAPRFFLEFYYNPFGSREAEKRFTYTVPTAYPIEALEVDVQQPLQATDFTLDPPSIERLTDTQGFTYHQSAYRDIRQGQTHTFTISYTKAVASPSIPKQPPTSQLPARPSPPPRKTLLSLSILACTILAFTGWALLLGASHPRHVPDAYSALQSTPTPDALLALLQAEDTTQETTVAMPSHPHTRIVNFCTHCGHKVLPDDRFCAKCGNAIKR